MFISRHTLKWTKTCRSSGDFPHAHTAHFLLNRHSQYSDHPRACGANHAIARSCGVGNGSSPRVRGKQVVAVLEHAGQRIIPARAGQTWARPRWRLSDPDHPRACGANISGCPSRTSLTGSSPRVRGKPVGAPTVRVRRRIIPARAGQTPPATCPSHTPPDHPRACGANLQPLIP